LIHTEFNDRVPVIPRRGESIVTTYCDKSGAPFHSKPVPSQIPDEPSPSVTTVAVPALRGRSFKGRNTRVPSSKVAKISTESVDKGSTNGNPRSVVI
jgi:hypothetical protein